eukprot:TRINITY_DN29276_c0_g1_i1.p1 TRINITY_DN29276_c0_g1~~TRINITY_DN29276_c0_g1_i1.p1  ORF type:complete len:867 (-),score=127.07 TRINITY_DN29276_c0_g1_i1:25-2625(-)
MPAPSSPEEAMLKDCEEQDDSRAMLLTSSERPAHPAAISSRWFSWPAVGFLGAIALTAVLAPRPLTTPASAAHPASDVDTGSVLEFATLKTHKLPAKAKPETPETEIKTVLDEAQSGECEVGMADIMRPEVLDHAKASWPTLASGPYEAISKCLTQVPYCMPHKLMGNPDVRSTYAQAASTDALSSYMDTLEDITEMFEVRGEVCGKSSTCEQQFTHAKEQLITEVRLLIRLQAYFDGTSAALEELSSLLKDSLQENAEMLLEETDKGSTTTTTTKKTIGWMKVFAVAFDILSAVGGFADMAGVFTDGDDVNKAAKKMVTLATFLGGLGSAGEGIQGTMEEFGVGDGGDGGDGDGGYGALASAAEEDNSLDEELLTLDQFVQRTQSSWQNRLVALRMKVASNYGMLLATAPFFEVCAFGDETQSNLMTLAAPAIGWFAFSLLVPNKYIIYMQRSYSGNTPNGATSVSCTTADANAEVQPFTTPGVSTDECNSVTPTRSLWIGQKSNPSNVPGSGFWSFFMKQERGLIEFLVKMNSSMTVSPQGISDAIVSQCQYVTKVFITDSQLSTYSYPSTEVLRCKVFGAPWLVNTLADCGGTFNGFYYDSSNVGYNVANFNAQVWIPAETHEWGSQGTGLVGCCSPYGGESAGDGCDFPVCDCATLAAAWAAGNKKGTGIIDAIWWGVCPIKTYSTGLMDAGGGSRGNWQSAMSFPGNFLNTSIGLSWPQLLRSHAEVKSLIGQIPNWKEYATFGEAHKAEIKEDTNKAVRSLLVPRIKSWLITTLKSEDTAIDQFVSASSCGSCSDDSICGFSFEKHSGTCASKDYGVEDTNTNYNTGQLNPEPCGWCTSKYGGKYMCHKGTCECKCKVRR